MENPQYLAYIRRQPCLICRRPAEPHHLRGLRYGSGTGLKAPDEWAVPLCPDHHRELHDHGVKTFCSNHQVNLDSWVSYLQAKFITDTL